tara:strand:- start:1202 stop:1309 length:108 start_codon:yes stop_codon:yes gene_type:complete
MNLMPTDTFLWGMAIFAAVVIVLAIYIAQNQKDDK